MLALSLDEIGFRLCPCRHRSISVESTSSLLFLSQLLLSLLALALAVARHANVDEEDWSADEREVDEGLRVKVGLIQGTKLLVTLSLIHI